MPTRRRPSKVKIPYFGNVNRSALIEDGATVGATIGLNLFGPDGEGPLTVAQLAALLATQSSSSTPPDSLAGLSVTLWRLIREVPIYTNSPVSPTWEYTLDGDPIGNVGFAATTNALATGSAVGDLVLVPEDGSVYVPTDLRVRASDGVLAAFENATDSGAGLFFKTAFHALGSDVGIEWREGGAVSNSTFELFMDGTPAADSHWQMKRRSQSTGLSTVFEVHRESAGLDFIEPARISAGSVSLPSLTFVGDPNTGFYSGSADTIRIACGGVQVGFFNGSVWGPTVRTGAIDGSAAQPSYGFANEIDVGMYRIGTDNLGFSTGGVLRLGISTTGFTQSLPFLNPVLGPAGSSSLPSFAPSGDPNTGIFSAFADGLGFTAGGVSQMTISTGRVNIFGSGRLDLEHASPFLKFSETDAATNEKQWVWRSVAGVLQLDTYTDADAFGATAIAIDRNGTTVTEIELNATLLDFNGSLDLSGASHTLAATADPAFHITVDGATVPATLRIENVDARQAQVTFLTSSTLRGLFGCAGTANDIITGSAAGDFALRTQGGNMLFSVDSGSTIHGQLSSGAWTFGASGATPTHRLNTNTATTVGAAGAADPLPATPEGYIVANINGTDRKIPYYAT